MDQGFECARRHGQFNGATASCSGKWGRMGEKEEEAAKRYTLEAVKAWPPAPEPLAQLCAVEYNQIKKNPVHLTQRDMLFVFLSQTPGGRSKLGLLSPG